MPATYRPARYATAARHAFSEMGDAIATSTSERATCSDNDRWKCEHTGADVNTAARGVFSQVIFLKCGHVRKEVTRNEDNELGKKLELRVAQPGLVKMILHWLPPLPIWLPLTHASPPVWTRCWGGRSAPASIIGINNPEFIFLDV